VARTVLRYGWLDEEQFLAVLRDPAGEPASERTPSVPISDIGRAETPHWRTGRVVAR
jgi:hypothetical protein